MGNRLDRDLHSQPCPVAAPTQQDYELFDELNKQADEQLGKWDEIVKTDLASYNALAKQHEVPAVGLVAPEKP